MTNIGASNWRCSFDRSKGRSSQRAVDCESFDGKEAVEVSEAGLG